MILKINGKNTYSSAVFFIFSFLFLSPVLSPQINGQTIYLNWFIPFLDFQFLRYLFKHNRINKRVLCVILCLLSIPILYRQPIQSLKIATIVFSIIYLCYAYKKIGFSLFYKAFNINIYIAITQFVLYIYNPTLSYYLGPKQIASAIWGANYAGGNTNFYPIFFNIPRTCGLSREAGFFAALLNIVILIYFYDKNIKKSKKQIALFLIAYLVSFSKMSILLPVMIMVVLLRKTIDKIPLGVGFCIVWLVLGIFSVYLNQNGYFNVANESIAHRLYGYGIVFNNLSFKEILFGNANGLLSLNNNAQEAYPIFAHLISRSFDSFCGYPELIICFGYIGLAVFLISCYYLHIETSGLLILLLATIDVDLTTATSFVVLAYWLVINQNNLRENTLQKQCFSPCVVLG